MVNYVGLGTLIRRELKRTYMVINQVVWPPVIMTLLFLFIFGLSLGSRIKTLGGVPYVEFLLPGLIMLNVISSSYDEAASSLFTPTTCLPKMLRCPPPRGTLSAVSLSRSTSSERKRCSRRWMRPPLPAARF